MNKSAWVASTLVVTVIGLLAYFVSQERQSEYSDVITTARNSAQPRNAEPGLDNRTSGVDFDLLMRGLPSYEKPSAQAFKAFHEAEIEEFRQQKDYLAYMRKYAYSDSAYERQKSLRGLGACFHSMMTVVDGMPVTYPPIESANDPRFAAWKDLLVGCESFAALPRQNRGELLEKLRAIYKDETTRMQIAIRNIRNASADSRHGLLAELELELSSYSGHTLNNLASTIIKTDPARSAKEPVDEVKRDAFSAALCDFMRECGPTDRRGRDRCFAWVGACNLTETEQMRLLLLRDDSQAHVDAFDQWRQVYVEALRNQDWKTILEIK
jgi:hypothetical protein